MHGLWRSRLGVVLVFGLLLLALDVGRSIWARVGLAHPSAEYRPEPAQYADLTWPPGADVDRGAPLGVRVFARYCAVCHGPTGHGNGPAAPSMFPRPRDFSAGRIKYKSTAAGEPPTDEDLLRTVREGLPASAMPYFAGLLSAEELRAVVEQVKSYSSAFSQPGRPSKSPLRSRVRHRVWRAERRCLPIKAAPRATATTVGAASATTTVPATQCTRAISRHPGLFAAAGGPRTSGCG